MDMSARARIAAGYEPRWDIDAADGHHGVLFVADVLDAMRDQSSVEVKRDREAVTTGNIYLEYLCYVSGQWVPSGIAHTSAELFSVAIAPAVVITSSVEAVRDLARIYYADRRNRRECTRGSYPTKGVIVPVASYVLDLMRRGPPALPPGALVRLRPQIEVSLAHRP